MTNEILRANLTNLRTRHNMNTNQIAMICGIDEATYTKMELGFEDASYEILTKLAGFYGVDVGKMVNEKMFDHSHENLGDGAKKVKVTYNKTKKAFEILSLIFAVVVVGFYFIFPVNNNSINFRLYHYLYANGITLIVAVIYLLIPIWQITNSIILLSSEKLKQGTYGKVTKIIDVATSGLMVLISMLFCSWGGYYTFVFIILTALLLLFEILALAKRKKEKIQK